jgi:hypothetical protein
MSKLNKLVLIIKKETVHGEELFGIIVDSRNKECTARTVAIKRKLRKHASRATKVLDPSDPFGPYQPRPISIVGPQHVKRGVDTVHVPGRGYQRTRPPASPPGSVLPLPRAWIQAAVPTPGCRSACRLRTPRPRALAHGSSTGWRSARRLWLPRPRHTCTGGRPRSAPARWASYPRGSPPPASTANRSRSFSASQ